MIGVVLFVVRNELSCVLVFSNEMRMYEADEAIRVRVLLELKVDAVSCFHDVHAFFMRVVLKDQLFQV